MNVQARNILTDNTQIRKKWDNKKFVTRFKYSIVATVLILIGFELSSPAYSFTTTIVENVVANSDTLRSVIDSNILRDIFVKENPTGSDIPIYTGENIKFAIFFIVLLVTSNHFLSNDPLSNSELLRAMVRKKEPAKPALLFRYMKELDFYSKEAPSNRLPEKCNKCVTPACKNRIYPESELKTRFWNSIFSELSINTTEDISKANHKCRTAFFLRYSVWLPAAVLVVVYIIVRVFEYFEFGYINTNLPLLVYIFSLWAFGYMVGIFNAVSHESQRGVWGAFSERISDVLHSKEFHNLFDRNVCKYKSRKNTYLEEDLAKLTSYSEEIHRLVTLTRFLDDVIKNKAIRSFSNPPSVGDKQSLRAILMALTKMLYIINYKKVNFRACLFVLNDKEGCLTSLVSVPLKDKKLVAKNQSSIINAFLRKDSKSIAVDSFNSGIPVSAQKDNIPYFYKGQSDHLKSLICVPLVIDKDLHNAIKKCQIKVDEVIGVLVVDCDSADYFATQNQESNLVEIMPFVNRLIFEMVHSLIVEVKDEKG